MHNSQVQALQNTPAASVTLQAVSGQTAEFLLHDKSVTAKLQLHGIYNIYNAAAALALVHVIVGEDCDQTKLLASLSDVTPAFGRGETITVNGQPVELVLVKNPSGFRLSLASFKPADYATMIAINDNYADGRDMSWLWDVNFESLADAGVAEVTGVRAYDMTLRLQYDEIEVSHIDPNISSALKHFLDSHSSEPKRIYCTYTAMLTIRRELAKITTVEQIS